MIHLTGEQKMDFHNSRLSPLAKTKRDPNYTLNMSIKYKNEIFPLLL